MVGFWWTMAAAFAADPVRDLRNTGPLFLAGEFGASVFLGFFVPDLLTTPQPEGLGCADAWCEQNGFDLAVREALVLDHPRAAGTVSHVFTVGLTPAVAFGGAIVGAAGAGRAGPALQDSVVMLDAFLLATGANSVAKVSARRQRPGFAFGREGLTEAADHPAEEFVSFYSGDTTWAFALASSGTTLAYLRGYRHAPIVAVAGGALALTGGALRISADMHWATDVLTGAAVGTALGVALPLAVHGRVKHLDGASITTTPDGTTIVGIRGSW